MDQDLAPIGLPYHDIKMVKAKGVTYYLVGAKHTQDDDLRNRLFKGLHRIVRHLRENGIKFHGVAVEHNITIGCKEKLRETADPFTMMGFQTGVSNRFFARICKEHGADMINLGLVYTDSHREEDYFVHNLFEILNDLPNRPDYAKIRELLGTESQEPRDEVVDVFYKFQDLHRAQTLIDVGCDYREKRGIEKPVILFLGEPTHVANIKRFLKRPEDTQVTHADVKRLTKGTLADVSWHEHTIVPHNQLHILPI